MKYMGNDKARLKYTQEQLSNERMNREAWQESCEKTQDENFLWMIACGVLAILNVLQVII